MMPRPMAMVSSTFNGSATVPTVMVGRLKVACTLWGLAPNSTMARFSKKMLMARAVIRADIRAGLAHRAVSQNLDQHADHGTDRNGDDDRQPGGHTRVDHKRDGIKQCVGTNHDQITMGEVDHADDAVNHCVAQGNQCVDRALVQNRLSNFEETVRKSLWSIPLF